MNRNSPDFSRALVSTQAHELHEILPLSLISVMLLGGLLVILFRGSPEWNTVLLWYAFFTLIVLAHIFLFLRRHPLIKPEDEKFMHIFRLCSYMRGTVWGSATWVLLYQEHWITNSSMITVMVLSGVAAGAAGSLAVDRNSATGFIIMLLGQVLLYFLLIGNLIAGVMVVFFIWYLVKAIDTAHNRFLTNLSLRLDAEARENKLGEALVMARQADRVKDDFLRNVSHDLRTPMIAIDGITGLLSKAQSQQEQKDLLNKLHSSSDQMLKLVDNLLDFTRLNAGDIEFVQSRISLQSLLAQVESEFSPRAREQELTYECHLDQHIPGALKGDANRLRQILSTLISNAIKYTDHGGVSVSSSLAQEDSLGVVVKFLVKDSGKGVPATKIDTFFNKDELDDRSSIDKLDNIRLGLHVVKLLVERQGGKISVASKVNRGTEISFTLPLGKYHQDELNETNILCGVGGDNAQTTPLHILLADDVDMNRFVISRQLKSLWKNATIDMAENGQAAVDMLGRKPYHIVLMDLQMPVMDGHQATAAIRKLPPPANNVPVIAITAGTIAPDELRATGFNDWLLKPFSPETLYNAINNLRQIKRVSVD